MHVESGPPASEVRAPRTWRFLLTPRWLVLGASVVAFALACYFFLAPWQFQRSSEHDVQQREIAAAVAADPAAAGDLMSTTAQPPASAVWRQVTASGEFDPDSQAYIRLRQDNSGQPAFEVVVGFVTDDGTRLLVDRGYVPFAAVQSGAALPSLPTGTVAITARVQQDQTDPRNRPPSSTPDGTTAYNAVSSTILTDAAGAAPTFRGYVQLSADSPGVLDPIALPVDNSRPFYSYAIQWLSFGAIALIGFGYFIYREIVDPAGDTIYVDASGADDDPPDQGDQLQGRADEGGATKARRQKARRGFDKSSLYD